MKKIRILVVEDMAQMRSFLKMTIEYAFDTASVETVGNAGEAKLALLRENFDLILCDWEMPGLKGDEFFLLTRENPAWKDIPFVMLTAKTNKESVMRAVSLGIANYIVKPVTVDILVSKLSSILPQLRSK